MKACSNCGSVEFNAYRIAKFAATVDEEGVLKIDDTQDPDYNEIFEVICVKCNAEYNASEFKSIE